LNNGVKFAAVVHLAVVQNWANEIWYRHIWFSQNPHRQRLLYSSSTTTHLPTYQYLFQHIFIQLDCNATKILHNIELKENMRHSYKNLPICDRFREIFPTTGIFDFLHFL